MFILPYQINANEYEIFIVIQDINIERMQAYDPAQVVMKDLGREWASLRLSAVYIGYGTAEDLAKVETLAREGKPMREAFRFLSRGFQFRPDLGDSDEPYDPIKV